MTEAALLMALMLGGRFGLVTFGRGGAPLYKEVIDGHGFSGRLAAIRPIEATALDAFTEREAVESRIAEAALRLVREDGADAVVLSGAAMAGMARTLAERVPVPLVDGIACGVAMAEALVRIGFRKAREGSYAAPSARETVGLSPELARLLKA
jgi:allantoin racemase